MARFVSRMFTSPFMCGGSGRRLSASGHSFPVADEDIRLRFPSMTHGKGSASGSKREEDDHQDAKEEDRSRIHQGPVQIEMRMSGTNSLQRM